MPARQNTPVALFLVVAASIAGSSHAADLPVLNPSFETPAFAPCTFGSSTSWIGGGSWNPGLGEQCILNGFPDGVPDGVQCGFINSGAITQTVGTVAAETQYTLQVDVGRRSDCCQMIAYAVRLVSGAIVLAADENGLDPAEGTFETSTISFNVPAGHPAVGQPLTIQLALVSGGQADFDNVHLFTGAPVSEPGDLNEDGTVNGADLGLLLGSWGACAACAGCAADINGDCTVNGADLGILLGNWG